MLECQNNDVFQSLTIGLSLLTVQSLINRLIYSLSSKHLLFAKVPIKGSPTKIGTPFLNIPISIYQPYPHPDAY